MTHQMTYNDAVEAIARSQIRLKGHPSEDDWKLNSSAVIEARKLLAALLALGLVKITE